MMILSVLLMAALILPASGWAFCPDDDCDPAADVVLVRKNCTGLQNCFESVSKLSGASELCTDLRIDTSLAFGEFVGATAPEACKTNGWLWSIRSPSASSPVVIDVGPGTFEPFVCPFGDGSRLGHVTIRGAGRDQTKFVSESTTAILIHGCDELTFSELIAYAPVYAVRWIGGGEASWSRVDMIANADLAPGSGLRAGWADGCYASDKATSTHFIYDSRSVVSGTSSGLNAAYLSDCAVTYYFGGALVNSTTMGSFDAAGLLLGGFPFLVGNEPTRFQGFDVEIVVKTERVQGDGVGVDVRADTAADLQDGSIGVRVVPNAGESADAVGIRTQTGASARRLATPIEVETSSGNAMDREDL